MRECILSLFWPKKKIIEFLQSVDTPPHLLPAADTEMSRHALVTHVFAQLGARPDRGYTVFQTMIDRLSNWSYFDPYYFDNLKKLDKGEAVKQIELLKRAVEKRNASTVNRRAAAQAAQQQRDASIDLTTLKSAFTRVFGAGMSPQERGRLFEVFLKQLFQRQSVPMGDPFRLTGEQIDGSFKFEGENYIIEAKWQDASTSTAQLYVFAHKVDGKMYGRGLFISANGFSSEGLRAVVHGKHIQTILVDGEDLSHVLDGRITLKEMLDYKIRAAQIRGEVYVCSLRRCSKV
ncbi:restriction endonuclease [Phenylobacterium sp.]|uniref:restriction endonuclease n=1 Tax=Phenylobacterium sp. TaxID=1871053 RepID=UPI002811784B|nr:restriction endonuclease [Phenylobacterium sp.]